MSLRVFKNFFIMIWAGCLLYTMFGVGPKLGASAGADLDYSYIYDQSGKIEMVILPTGQVIDYQNDLNGNLLRRSVTALNNSARPQVTLSNPTGSQSSPTITTSVRPTITWTQSDDNNRYVAFNVKVSLSNSSEVIVNYYGANSMGYWMLDKNLQIGQMYQIEVSVTDGEVWSNRAIGWIQVQQDVSTIPEYVGKSLYFDGTRQIEYTNVTVDTTTGAKNTVEFWMNWGGTDSVMPFSWNAPYDLWFNNGSFGFNTGNGDLLGISSVVLKNKWVHVAAVFYNGLPSGATNELYINGVKQVITQKQGVPDNRVVTPTLYISGWGTPKGSYLFNGKIADVHIWNRALTVSQIQQNMYSTLAGNELGLVGRWELTDRKATPASFDGSRQLEYTNVAVNTTSGAQNSVEFWMKWDGTDNVMPFSWNGVYDLWFNNGSFGFNTGNGDILGTSSTDLKNKWVHVTAIFYNGLPSASMNELYFDGVKQIISQKQGIPDSRVVTPTLFISGWGTPRGSYLFKGQLADVRIWNRAISTSQIQGDMYTVLSGTELGLVGHWNP